MMEYVQGGPRVEEAHSSPPGRESFLPEQPSGTVPIRMSGTSSAAGRPMDSEDRQRPENEGPEQKSRPIQVLIVDDDRETARALERSLVQMNAHVAVTSSGPAALDLLKAERFDVLLSDIGMPGMDGFDLLDAVREFDQHLPIVLLTGDPTITTAARALEVGAFRYVTKPVTPVELSLVVEKAARSYRTAKSEEEALHSFGHGAFSAREPERLYRAFDRCLDSLWMAFQPIVEPRAQRIFGFESLLRSPELDFPHPGVVLDVAERLGRLDELGRMVRRLTAQAIPSALEHPVFFVNLHVRDLLDPTLLSPHSPLLPFAQQVVLEVTERASLAEVPDLRTRIAALREAGFRIAVDDLGAGYAGLTTFALLEPEFVKLDMSLIRDIERSPTKRKVVRSMVNLSQDMGMLVVGEGIETEQERDVLIELGCDLLQGYLFARPAVAFPEAQF